METILWTSNTNLNILFGVLVVVALLLVTRKGQIPKGLRLPPGPPGRPIVGNLGDMPTHREWETFSRWAKEYGDLVSLNVLGQRIISVNSVDVARDLFDRRSSNFSDRISFPMLGDLMGFSWSFGFMRYGQWWRRHRRMFYQYFHPTAAASYHGIQAKHTRELLRRLHKSPDDFVDHFRHLAGATIMEIVYGINVLPKNDPHIETAERGVAALAEAGNPGTFLVDHLPILKHVPEWVPGAGFQKKARMWRIPITQMAVAPFMAVKQALSAGTAGPSVTASLLEELRDRQDAPSDEEDVIRNVAAVAYGAGSDTIVSALSTFVLAMLLYPRAQVRAQVELDEIVGMGRLPRFEDRKNLPYVNALCKEVLRWHPTVPLGIAHKVMQDDTYGNYFLPGGSMILGNAWTMLHDENAYGPETDKFQPERFFKPGVKDPTAAFGFGRRICPGRYMVDNSMYLVIASILLIFNISPARDDRGNEILPVAPLFTSGFLSRPEQFQCTIKPRSAAAENLLMKQDNE